MSNDVYMIRKFCQILVYVRRKYMQYEQHKFAGR